MEILAEIVIGVAISFIGAVLYDFRKEWKQAEADAQEKRLARDKALKDILGYHIDNVYEQYTELKYIPTDKLGKVCDVYTSYKMLGGNGTREMEISKLKELPNVPTKDN